MARAHATPSLLAALLVVTTSLAPIRLAAAAPSVEQLYAQGQEKFDAGAYAEAGALWSEAVRALPEDPDNTATRQTIMNLALAAYVRAYKGDGDRAHLDAAMVLITDYRASLEPSGVSVEANIAAMQLDIEHMLDDWEAAHATASEPEPAPELAPEPEPEPSKPGRGLVIGGGVMLGVGAAGLGLMVGGMVGGRSARLDYEALPADAPELDSIRDRGVTMNVLAISGAVAGGLLIGGGVALLVIGLRRNGSSKLAVLPSFGPDRVGIGVVGRF
jgi:hypothetical protein